MSGLNGLGIDDNVVDEMRANFEEQRRHIGKAHQFRNKACHLSKIGISELGEGNPVEKVCQLSDLGINELGNGSLVEAEIHFTECQMAFDELEKLNLPEDMMWEFRNSAAQEMVELMALIKVYPFLIGKQGEIQIPNNHEMDVSETAWLAGIADAAGEINKLMVDIEYHQLASIDILSAYERGVTAIQEMEKLLDKFALVYPLVVSNTRRRGQGFSNKLRYVRMAALYAKKEVNQLRRMKHN